MNPLLPKPRLPVELISHICDILRVRVDNTSLRAVMRSSSLLYGIASPKLYRTKKAKTGSIGAKFSSCRRKKGGRTETAAEAGRWKVRLRLFRLIQEIVVTGLFAAEKGKKGDYRHDDIAHWAFAPCPLTSLRDRKVFLLPSLRKIDMYSDRSVGPHPAITFHVRPILRSDRYEPLAWNICLRIASPVRTLDHHPIPLLFHWLNHLQIHRQVYDLAIHSYDDAEAVDLPLTTSNTCRVYTVTTSGRSKDRVSARDRAWDTALRNIAFSRTYVRIFGTFDAAPSPTSAEAERKAMIRKISSREECEHRQEEVGAPKVEGESGLWFAPDGYREGCMCGAEIDEGSRASEANPVIGDLLSINPYKSGT